MYDKTFMIYNTYMMRGMMYEMYDDMMHGKLCMMCDRYYVKQK